MAQHTSASSPRRYVCVVSDATGATAERVVRATLEQFDDVAVDLDVVPNLSSCAQLAEIVDATRQRGGLIAYTLVRTRLRSEIVSLANEAGVATVDLIGPVLHALSTFLSARPAERPGHRFDRADPEHFRRLEAVSYTVRHDDGMALAEIGEAEIVIVGPSRTSKTPLSAYLAHTRGLKVANVPLALGIDPPEELAALPPHRIVGLTMSAPLLCEIRRERARHLGATGIEYAQAAYVEKELHYCHEVYRRAPAWPVVDVTGKSVEEVAAAVCALTVDAPAAAT